MQGLRTGPLRRGGVRGKPLTCDCSALLDVSRRWPTAPGRTRILRQGVQSALATEAYTPNWSRW